MDTMAMNHQEHFWQYQEHTIHAIQFGEGAKLLLAFHGYGDSCELFLKLEPSLAKHYTVIAIDLPYHGQTAWQASHFSPQDIVKLVEFILNKQTQTNFSLLAYSMGGRFPLAIYNSFQNQIERIFFVASAGFQPTLAYNKWLFPGWIRRFLRWVVRKPNWIAKFFYLGHKVGLLNASTYHVFERQLKSEEHRQRLFNIWVAFYKFPIQLKKFKQYVLQQQLPIHFFYGDKDKITSAHWGDKFVKDIPTATLDITKGNHFFIRKHLDPFLDEWLSTFQ
ncbi:MAG: alpha/beta hydrolase [Aureispira sp.]|nr:alpha/beta hydrolase [Aureispira sp.]